MAAQQPASVGFKPYFPVAFNPSATAAQTYSASNYNRTANAKSRVGPGAPNFQGYFKPTPPRTKKGNMPPFSDWEVRTRTPETGYFNPNPVGQTSDVSALTAQLRGMSLGYGGKYRRKTYKRNPRRKGKTRKH